MKFSASAAFGALLLLSLAAKAVLIAPAPDPDSRHVARAAEAMLRDEGFRTAFEPRPSGLFVHARRGGCRLLVVDYNPYGTFAATIAERTRPVGPLHFAYRGELYARAPKLIPLFDFYLYRELRRIGIGARRHPVAAIAARGCDLGRFDWRRLAVFPD